MSKSTIFSEACNKVVGFEQMGEEFIRKPVIAGRAKSTHRTAISNDNNGRGMPGCEQNCPIPTFSPCQLMSKTKKQQYDASKKFNLTRI